MRKAFMGLTLSLVLISFIVLGCQTSADIEENSTVSSNNNIGTDYKPRQFDDEEKPAAPEAAKPKDADSTSLTQELKQQQQELAAAARWTLIKAQSEIQEGRYDSAKDLLQDILEQLSTFAATSKELTEFYTQLNTKYQQVLKLLGESGKTLDDMATGYSQLVDEARMEVKKHFEDGKEAMAEESFEDAIAAFERALEIIRWAPYAKDLEESFQKSLHTLKQECEVKLREQRYKERELHIKTQKELEILVRKQAEKQKLEDIQALWQDALFNMQLRRFSTAEMLCEQILALDTEFNDARRMLSDIKKARIKAQHDDNLTRKLDMYRRLWVEWYESKVPLANKNIQYPKGDEWLRIKSRSEQMLKDIQEAPEVLLIKNAISTKTMNLPAYDGLMLTEVIKDIRSKSGINIIIKPDIQEDCEDFEVQTTAQRDITVKDFLNYILDGSDYRWVVGQEKNGLVWIVGSDDTSILTENMVVRIHDVRDLTIRVRDFSGMRIRLRGNATGSDSGPIWEPDEPVAEPPEVEDLQELIEDAIAPDSWGNGASIQTIAGQLLVRNTPEAHSQIEDFLQGLRDVSGLVVTIEARFITVDDMYLSDFGIDWRGLGGQSPGNTIMLDDVTVDAPDSAGGTVDNGANAVPPGQAIAGLFFNDGTANTSQDIRGRFENVFDTSLGNVLRTTGGLGLQYTIFSGDNSQFQLVINALQKNKKATVLTSSRLSAFNTQRANLVVINQVAYVRDFSVQTAVSAAVADPIVDTISDGLVLDCKPTVSNDHRFITIEIRPTVATLLRPIPAFTTTLGGPGSTPVTIQLPELIVQSFETTVMCPDGGLVVVGGFKSIRDIDREATTPIIGDIPILGNLFKRKGRSLENRSLIVVVKAEVTDLHEQEDRMP